LRCCRLAIELEIGVVPHKGGGSFWSESERSELAYEDSAGVIYVNRKVATAYADTQQWKTVADVIGFFDDQMRGRGWTLISTGGSDPAVPETRLLRSENIRSYFRPQDAGPESPYVVVVTWPIGGKVDGFNVVLTTVSPSLLSACGRPSIEKAKRKRHPFGCRLVCLQVS
jgi:hypothetical protein